MSEHRYYLANLARLGIGGLIVAAVLFLGGVIWWGAILFALVLVACGMLSAFEQLHRTKR